MFYTLNDNVYLVNGKARSAIYDFNNLKIYSINNKLAKELNLVNETGIKHDSIIDADLKKIYDEFIKLELLSLSEKTNTQKIEDIKSSNCDCRFAWIEVTNKCNLKCLHCYNESTTHCDKHMSLTNYKMVIDKLLNMSIKKIQIIGGEPFCIKKSLKYMLDYTVGKFEFIEIFTNGTLLTEEWLDYISKNNIHIALSVYSYDAVEHDKVTGVKGSWSKTNKTIEKIEKYNINYRVCNVLMKNVNIGEKNTNLYKLSNKKDIIRMSGRASFDFLSDELINKKLITKETFSEPIKKSFCSLSITGHNCFRNKIYISADMKVYPCVMERRLIHCDINEYNDIILNENFCNLNKDKIEECCDCEYRYACYDCRPDSLTENILAKPWYCTYNPISGEWMDRDIFVKELKKKYNKCF